jgi:transposase
VRINILSTFLLLTALAVTLVVPAPVDAWQPLQRHPAIDPRGDREDAAAAAIRARMEREAAKQWNKERQAALKKDTDKLLELATQLKQQVDKSNENILSVDVLKKTEEIEKLAHNVHEKMKADGY